MLPLALFLALQAPAVPSGQIIDSLSAAAAPEQTYSLYLPSSYDSRRTWPVIFAFDPAAHGRTPVERYQKAAEKYGFIVAGSNNSRNGPWAVSAAAAEAITRDVSARFSIDEKRVYLAGMSGGSRVALEIGLRSGAGLAGGIAGVLASSAGFMDNKRTSAPFPIFGSAGTEDFNYLEMRYLDRALTSPHRLAVFEGGHVWLPEETAMWGVEWLELQAMKSGLKERDEREIDEIFRKRSELAQGASLEALLAAQSIVSDFNGLQDTKEIAGRAAQLAKDKSIQEARKKDRDDLDREQRLIDELLAAERKLSGDEKIIAMADLRGIWKRLAAASKMADDSPDRRRARRVLRGLSTGVNERTPDPDYRKLVSEYRPARGR